MSETHEARIKRMKMRSWRRGIREMDLILGPYADAKLEGFDTAKLDLFDTLLEENDQDLYPWFSGAQPCPPQYVDLFAEIAAFMQGKLNRA